MCGGGFLGLGPASPPSPDRSAQQQMAQMEAERAAEKRAAEEKTKAAADLEAQRARRGRESVLAGEEGAPATKSYLGSGGFA